MTNITWLRRDLRTYDHAPFHAAMQADGQVLPLFIFDSDILSQFADPDDRRLGFILHALKNIHEHAKKYGSGVLVCYGKPIEIWRQIQAVVQPANVYAGEDFEAATRARDAAVEKLLKPNATLHLLKDHVMFTPTEIYSQSGTPFKVFTPYSKAWWAGFEPAHMAEYPLRAWEKLCPIAPHAAALKACGVKVLDLDKAPEALLAEIGYRYTQDALWQPEKGRARLAEFVQNILGNYKNTRDMVAEDGTSQLSPHLRFGTVSIRDCFRQAYGQPGSEKWLSELIWREFYSMVMYHAPESAATEWNPIYRGGKLNWSQSEADFQAWCEGKTGYPIVDAAMRQLVLTGWMHNRARMIVASFLTKDLHIDWRKGEAFFAHYLMDYELASNVGGWQWAASTGTDAQPYFRIFNPYLQSRKFDPMGHYIRRYVPELAGLDAKSIHEPHLFKHGANYPKPIVEHAKARDVALKMFKEIS